MRLFRKILGDESSKSSHHKKVRNPGRRTLRLESLEDRSLLSVTPGTLDLATLQESGAFEEGGQIWVTTGNDVVADDGQISLREAIQYAYASIEGVGTVPAGIRFLDSVSTVTVTSTLGVGNELPGIKSTLMISSMNTDGELRDITVTGANSINTSVFVFSKGLITLEGLTITGGGASDNNVTGGGLLISASAEVTLNSCVVRGNTAQDGGGIYNSGTLTLNNTVVSGNRTVQQGGRGGGIYNLGKIEGVDSKIIGNSSGVYDSAASYVLGYGGGLYNYGGRTTWSNTLFADNRASRGGGIYTTNLASNVGTIIFYNSTIANNTATTVGTISGNGGGVYIDGTTNRFYNTIVAVNNATNSSASDIFRSGMKTISASHSLSSFNSTGFIAYSGDGSDLFTDMGAGDYSLLYTDDLDNPAVNTGLNSYAVMPDGVTALSFDITGNVPRIVAETVDIGAYEAGEAASSVVTISADIVDPYDGEISLREAIQYVSNGIVAGPVTFNDGLTEVASVSEFLITDVVTIDGGESRITIQGECISRLISVVDGVGSDTNGVRLVNLDFLNGGGYSAAELANGNGGALYVGSSSYVTVENCRFEDNQAVLYEEETPVYGNGGAVYNNGNLVIAGSEFSYHGEVNNALNGGAVYNADGTLTLVNSIISDMVVSGDGGAVYSGAGTTNLVNCTIRDNSVLEGNGAGVYAAAATNIQNTIIVANRKDEDTDDIYDAGETPWISANHSISGYNLSELGSNNYLAEISEGEVYVDGKALFAAGERFSTWANSLTDKSVAVDAGNNEYINNTGYSDYDYNGEARILNSTVDIGALERMIEASYEGMKLIVNVTGDATDPYDGNITLREAIEYAGYGELGTEIRFGETVFVPGEQTTITLEEGELVIDKGLTIDAMAQFRPDFTYNEYLTGVPGIFIDADSASRIFNISSSDLVTLEGLAMMNGVDENGGAVIVQKTGNVQIEQGYFLNNKVADAATQFGGHIANRGTLTMIDFSIACLDNFLSDGEYNAYYGGGIYNNGTLTLSATKDSYIYNNSSSGNGGGIANCSTSTALGTLNISGSVYIIANNANGYGGGLGNWGAATLNDTIIQGNTANNDGGGITNGYYIADDGVSFMVLNDVVISENSANYGGGVVNGTSLTFNGGSVLQNTAFQNGGGISNTSKITDGEVEYSGTLVIRHSGTDSTDAGRCLISGNKAEQGCGAGIGNSGTIDIQNADIQSNVALYGGGIATNSQYNLSDVVYGKDELANKSTGDGDETADFWDYSLESNNIVVQKNTNVCITDTTTNVYYAWSENDQTYQEIPADWVRGDSLGLEVGEHTMTVNLMDGNGFLGYEFLMTVKLEENAPSIQMEDLSVAGTPFVLYELNVTGFDAAAWNVSWGDGTTTTYAETTSTLRVSHVYQTSDACEIKVELIDADGNGTGVWYSVGSYSGNFVNRDVLIQENSASGSIDIQNNEIVAVKNVSVTQVWSGFIPLEDLSLNPVVYKPVANTNSPVVNRATDELFQVPETVFTSEESDMPEWDGVIDAVADYEMNDQLSVWGDQTFDF